MKSRERGHGVKAKGGRRVAVVAGAMALGWLGMPLALKLVAAMLAATTGLVWLVLLGVTAVGARRPVEAARAGAPREVSGE